MCGDAGSELSFQALQAKIDFAFPDVDSKPRKGEYIGLSAMLAGLVILLMGSPFSFNNLAGKVLAFLGFIFVVSGGLVNIILWSIRTYRDTRFDDRSGAHELERDFAGYQFVVSWLREFPADHLKTRLIFTSHRIASWQQGISVVIGTIEKFGVLSVAVALYFQLKDAASSWPPNVTSPRMLLSFAVVLLYLLGMWAVIRKNQVARFQRFLTVALDPDFKIIEPPPPSVESHTS